MTSSTSRFRHLFLVLLASLAGSYVLGAAYTLWINPEIRFWKEAYAVKVEHARQLDQAGQNKTVFVGGSSCAFQINTQLLEEEFGIPSVNMGMHAGMGARAIVALALPLLNPGDRLILNLEPGLLTGDLKPTSLGLQFLVATGNLKALAPLSSSAQTGWIEPILSLRPGLRNLVTMAGKLIAGRPLYRYHRKDIQSGGYLITDQIGAVPVAKVKPQIASRAALTFLSDIKNLIEKDNIDTQFLLPWLCVDPLESTSAKSTFASFSSAVKVYFPEVRDGKSGVDITLDEFADTSLHMKKSGATRRTRLLGVQL